MNFTFFSRAHGTFSRIDNILGQKPAAAAAAAAKLFQSCPTLCDPRDGSPPSSSVPGILQARTLEWVAISFSRAKKSSLGKFKKKLKSFQVSFLTTMQ